MKDELTDKPVQFKYIACPHELCHHEFEWISSRLPNYCPECGRRIYSLLRTLRDHIIFSDDSATLRIHKSTMEPY